MKFGVPIKPYAGTELELKEKIEGGELLQTWLKERGSKAVADYDRLTSHN